MSPTNPAQKDKPEKLNQAEEDGDDDDYEEEIKENMFKNALTPFSSLRALFTGCRRCWDRGCRWRVQVTSNRLSGKAEAPDSVISSMKS